MIKELAFKVPKRVENMSLTLYAWKLGKLKCSLYLQLCSLEIKKPLPWFVQDWWELIMCYSKGGLLIMY